jgi:uncharacterized protein YcfJ
MRSIHPLIRPAGAVAAGCLLMMTAACAGPRVGEVVGTPSPTAMTVQARVVSATPVIGQVTVPRQVCFDEMRQEAPRSSGAGAIIGAIAGGAMGNAVGKGAGKALATGLGIFGGAVVGDHVEMDGRQGTTRTVRRCEQQAAYENRVVAYNVVYEYGGQRYSTQMPQEPGATIPVQVTLTPALPAQPAPPPQAVYQDGGVSPAVYVQPEVIYEDAPRWHRRRWD